MWSIGKMIQSVFFNKRRQIRKMKADKIVVIMSKVLIVMII